MGKTTLLEAARRSASDFLVLSTVGVDAESEIAFAGLLDVLRPLMPSIEELPRPQRRALEAALGLRDGAVPDSFAVGAGTLGLLASAAEGSPVLCVLDDLQWVDAPSRAALLFAARRLDMDAVVVLAGARSEESITHDLAGFDVVWLEGLDPESTALIVGRMHADLAHRITGGNPLALTTLSFDEIADPLVEPPSLPDSVAQTYKRQLGGLPPAARRALLMATANDSGSAAVLQAALSLADMALSDLVPAELAGLVEVRGNRVVFRHPLVRAAVYHDANAVDARAVHAVLAEANLAEGDRGRAAWHLAGAASGPDERVAKALECVGESAASRGAHASAMRAYLRSAELTPSKATRTTRLQAAAASAHSAGFTDQAERLFMRTAREAATAEVAADALLMWSMVSARTGRRSGEQVASELLAEATTLRRQDPGNASRLIAGAAQALTFQDEDVSRAGILSRDAFRLAELASAVDPEVRYTYGYHAVLRGERATGLDQMRVAVGELAAKDASPQQLTALYWMQLLTDDQATSKQLAEQAVASAREQGAVAVLVDALSAMASIQIHTGEWASAEAACWGAIDLARETDQAIEAAFAWALLAELAACRGDEAALEDASAAAGPHANSQLWVSRGPRYAAAHLALARGEVARVLEVAPTLPLSTDPWFGYPCDRLEAMAILGDSGPARAEITDAGVDLPQFARGRVERCCGMLAAEDRYREHLEHSVEIFGELGCPFEAARSELRLGERLRRTGTRKVARDYLRHALESFEHLGASVWANHTRRELIASGAHLRSQPESRDRLTPQELQIARLIAEGRSNREVASMVFLSPKTIEAHLTRAYRKLDIHSRMQLASALERVAE
jgi:DNA-binding CsgD family transcriptional regulator